MSSHLLRGPAAAEFRMCSTGGCPNKAFARGLCSSCYASRRRAGDLPPKEQNREKLEPQKTWLPEGEDKQLRKMARETGRSCSEIIRYAVSEYLRRITEAREGK